MDEEKKYFWLRLRKDFFKRHDVRILEAMPNGKEYVLFYLVLLTESIDHEGALRFSDSMPYSTEMLATIANTSPKIAEGAIEALINLEMVELQEDGTLKMIGIENMIGFETKWAEKKRKYRQQKDIERTQEGQSEDIARTKKDNVRQEKEIEIDIKKKYKKKEPGKPGTRSRSMIHQQYDQRDLDFDSIEADFLGKKETEHGKHNKNSGEDD